MDAQATIWGHAITDALRDGEASARQAAERDGKPWTLHADRQTQNILADCPKRKVSEATAAKYRRAYEQLRAEGVTALDKASTRGHYDLLRTASRYCLETDVRAIRASSERARRAGHLEQAQRLTLEAWKLATELDVQFLQPDAPTWKDKAATLRKAGQPIPSKSKRDTIPPPPSLAVLALIGNGPDGTTHHGTKLAERHAERLALLALFGLRPAELKRGVRVWTQTDPATGGVFLAARVEGVKVNAQRGQPTRTLVVPVDNTAAQGLASAVRERGGAFVVTTTDADHRSLNRGLKACGLSCYSFRHAVANELKREVMRDPAAAAKAARFMGHASNKSLMSYGRARHARGGRRFGAKAERQVRSVPVTYAEKADVRQARATARAAVARLRKPGELSLPIPRPVLTIPSGPKLPWRR
ncbi:hypothetical protein NX869_20650 [Burkholderia thailandensis]|uniref:hypothetical protein n=1 Tax=Burkholderia thailandensis TaxID=57975 RepID=UPI00217E49CB|nr:hypothetical protein [Burkholderia thailandensis]MCS6478659.1 hypothetical protein [Burkholderia thailandensis]